MIETRNTTKGLDTGQPSTVNKTETSKRNVTKLESSKSMKNRQRNDDSNNSNNVVEDAMIVD